MDLFQLSHYEIKSFLLILLRVSVVLFVLPFFNSRVIPALTKAGLALLITILIFPVCKSYAVTLPDTPWELFLVAIGELIIGMILGMLVQLFFEAIRIMGQLVGIQTGFAITNVIDPQYGTQISILSNFAYLCAMVLFLTLNGHLILLKEIGASFAIIPTGALNFNGLVFDEILQKSGDMFAIAIKIGAPVIAALLFVQAAFGLITKLIPQMNIMIVGFPKQIVMGLSFFGISLEGMLRYMERYLGGMDAMLLNMMNLLKG